MSAWIRPIPRRCPPSNQCPSAVLAAVCHSWDWLDGAYRHSKTRTWHTCSTDSDTSSLMVHMAETSWATTASGRRHPSRRFAAADAMFSKLLELDLTWHLNKQTGKCVEVVNRGLDSLQFLMNNTLVRCDSRDPVRQFRFPPSSATTQPSFAITSATGRGHRGSYITTGVHF